MCGHQNRKGFTLTELLVVVAVILILMSLLVVCVDGLYTYAMQLKCQHRMEQIWTACVMYSTEHRGLLPAAWDFENNRPWYKMLAATNYIDNPDTLVCPSSDLATTTGSGEQTTALSIDVTATEEAISDALRYLQAQQQSDGRWGTDMSYYFGETGLAVLAFLGNGITMDHTEFGGTLKEGIRWLMNQVHTYNNGTFGQHLVGGYNRKHYNYHQGICTMALCDAARTMPDLELQMNDGTDRKLIDIAQEVFTYLIETQLYGHGGFPYEAGTAHDYWDPNQLGDVSISGWCWQAVMLARDAGLDPSQAKDKSTPWPFTHYTWESIAEKEESFFKLICPTNGTPGGGSWYPQTPYWFHSSGLDSPGWWIWYGHHGGGHLPSAEFRLTALSLGDRLVAGYQLDESAAYGTIERDGYEQYQWLTSTDLHIQNAQGTWYTPDLYFLYYMSLAMNKLRGAEWEEWIQILSDELINNLQESDGDYASPGGKGSFAKTYAPFPPSDIYTTALGAMSLEICIADALAGARWGGVSAPGQYSYGYNKLIANEDYRYRRPSGDTIILMDYLLSGIDAEDGPELIAPRHGGKANVLFGDSHVEALTVEDLTEPNTEGELKIKEHMLSLEPGPARLPDEEEQQ